MIDATAAITAEDAVIAFLAPIRAPRILDRPKRLRTENAVFHAVSNNQNAVIKTIIGWWRENSKEGGRVI